MTLYDPQNEVNIWAQQFHTPYWPPLEQLGRLIEEVGEVARELNHKYGSKKRKDSESQGNLGQELSDVIFTICCIANREGINLQAEWDKMMKEKHYGRDKDRFEKRTDDSKV